MNDSGELDSVDRALLRELQNDARQTNKALAEKVGVAPSTCLERIRELRARGVITGFGTIDGRKVAGILAEARDGRVVLGIGINANLTAEELPKGVDTPATSLLVERGERVDRARLLVTLLERIESRYEAWISEAVSAG